MAIIDDMTLYCNTIYMFTIAIILNASSASRPTDL